MKCKDLAANHGTPPNSSTQHSALHRRPPLNRSVGPGDRMRRQAARILAILTAWVATCKIARADVVWPALYLESRLFSLWAIPAGLLAEFAFLRWWLRLSVWRAIVADVVMNAASALIGLFAIPIAGLAWESSLGQLVNKTFNVGTFNPAAWLVTCVFAVLINTAIEALVLRLVFKIRLTRAQTAGLGLANLVSVGLAMASLQISPLRL
jgi:hypothetical protein